MKSTAPAAPGSRLGAAFDLAGLERRLKKRPNRLAHGLWINASRLEAGASFAQRGPRPLGRKGLIFLGEIPPVTRERAFAADAPPVGRTRLGRNGFAISTILRVI